MALHSRQPLRHLPRNTRFKHPEQGRGKASALADSATAVAGLKHFGTAMLALALHGAATANPDAEAGKRLYQQKCAGCHSVDANGVGPAHRGVFGRKVGSVPGFAYSKALQESPVVWTEVTLQAWLTNPRQLIPGQDMYFKVTDAKSREDIIAYLATLKP